MKLLEYEAKEMLRDYGLTTPDGRLLRGGDDDVGAGGLPVAVKAQVPVGGRGKAGGVKLARTAEEFAAARDGLLGRDLLGHRVNSVLAEELLEPVREVYMAVAVDRARRALVLLVHRAGGVDIEQAVREQGPALRVTLPGEPDAAVAAEVRAYLGLPESTLTELERIIGHVAGSYAGRRRARGSKPAHGNGRRPADLRRREDRAR